MSITISPSWHPFWYPAFHSCAVPDERMCAVEILPRSAKAVCSSPPPLPGTPSLLPARQPEPPHSRNDFDAAQK